VIKLRRMRCAEPLEYRGERRGAYRGLVGKIWRKDTTWKTHLHQVRFCASKIIFHFPCCRNYELKVHFIKNYFILTNCSNPNWLWPCDNIL
jgi:hypothetical protein